MTERTKEAGAVWTWAAVDANGKRGITNLVREPDSRAVAAFLADGASRGASRVQLTTDGPPLMWPPERRRLDGAEITPT